MNVRTYNLEKLYFYCKNCCSVAKLCDPMDHAPGSSVLTICRSWLKFTSMESVMQLNNLIICHLPLLLSSVFPSIRVFSKTIVKIHFQMYCVNTSVYIHFPFLFWFLTFCWTKCFLNYKSPGLASIFVLFTSRVKGFLIKHIKQFENLLCDSKFSPKYFVTSEKFFVLKH